MYKLFYKKLKIVIFITAIIIINERRPYILPVFVDILQLSNFAARSEYVLSVPFCNIAPSARRDRTNHAYITKTFTENGVAPSVEHGESHWVTVDGKGLKKRK